MTRGLEIVAADDAGAVQRALAAAMAGGPVVLPRDASLGVDLRADARELEALWQAERHRFPDDACLIIETSGSTGTPKRVVLTARALHASAAMTYERLDAAFAASASRPAASGSAQSDANASRGAANGPAQSAASAPRTASNRSTQPAASRAPRPTRQWLHCLPAHYIAGAQVLLRSLVAGTRPVELRGRFTADAFADAAERMDAERRYVSLVPVQLQRLLEAAGAATASAPPSPAGRVDAALRRFDAILVGGQATPRPVLDAARARGWRVVTTYGASETSGGCVYDAEPLPGVRVAVDDGELLLAGPQLAAGYLGDAERDARTFVERDGTRWYRTSDAGTIAREDGRTRIAVTGRLDHVIISGGEKVNLDVVERLVQQLPGFAEAVAVAVPHAEWGQAVAIVVAGDAPPATTPPQQDAAGTARAGAGAGACADAGAGAGAGADAGAGAGADAGAGASAGASAGAGAGAGPAVGAGAGGSPEPDADLERLRAACAAAGRAARPVRLIRIPELPRLASGKPDRRVLSELAAER